MEGNNKIISSYFQGLERQKKVKIDTLKGYKKELELFEKFIYPESFITQTNYSILRYIERLEERYSPLSIKKKITVLNGFYNNMLKNGVIDINPVSEITLGTIPKERESKVKKGEIRGVCDYCGVDPKGLRDKLLITLLTVTGEKITDLLSIRTRDIILFKEINILKKNGVIRLELDSETSEFLKEYIENQRDKIQEGREEYLFKELSRQNFRARFKKYCKMAGIENEISPTEIKKIFKQEKDSSKISELERMEIIRETYIKIGIGDD